MTMLKASLAAYQTDADKPDSFLIAKRLPETPALGNTPSANWTVENLDVVAAMARWQGRVGVMNFASPTNPGGGVEYGARAQEESIAKCTYLLPELRKFQSWYAANQAHPNDGLYSPAGIYTRHCRQVFDQGGRRLEPHYVDVMTIAAPNRRAWPDLTEDVCLRDIEVKVSQTLRAFKANGARKLILGAFGTGVFGNPVAPVGAIFGRQLRRSEFNGAFDQVVFAIYDRDDAVRSEFRRGLVASAAD
nr:TIGR02452 family protein [Lacticaseibacillus hulanensis]